MRPAEAAAIRSLLDSAFAGSGDGFEDHDWEHALGGLHVIALDDGEIVAHASVVERVLVVGVVPLTAGYVEGVATRPDRQGTGVGTLVMEAIDDHIRSCFQVGGLGTGAFHFYERLGWERWPGPTAVRTSRGVELTPDDDGYVMILRTPSTPSLDPDATISCDWRPGDAW